MGTRYGKPRSNMDYNRMYIVVKEDLSIDAIHAVVKVLI